MNRRGFLQKAAASIALAALAPELIGTAANPAPMNPVNLQQLIFADFSDLVCRMWSPLEIEITYNPPEWDGVKQFKDWPE